ncbi:alpha/beta hydrolase [Streptomyces sedi]|uniref:Alpha/beta hydrolase n=1 Tax=Streptomyces sedi TaxID=555059 RepID=A0A5C4VDD8_9ACTN|nr:alpha/beta hydrolase [Streptomyces sedi]TNM33416.1 alpha/beta hydrolase [Streptomyces sedi]
MRKPVTPVLAFAVTASLTLAGCSSADAEDGQDEESPAEEAISWGECPEAVAPPGLECSTIDVPLDYGNAEGETIEIAFSRLASEDPEKRRGVLLTNSGGPGGETLSMPATLRESGLPQSVLDSYDVIGIDPRGVGHSTPVTCGLELADHPSNIPTYARHEADVAAEAERVEAVAARCAESETADLLPHITTANTARDMDRVREALGESEVSYFGISYGTYLGAVYTTMFPENSDRFFLDSVTGPRGWDSSFARTFGEGFQDRFPDFAEFAAAEHETYGLGETPEEIEEKFFEIAEKLDAEPTPEGYNGQVFRHLTFDRFYYDDKLPELAGIWAALDTGQPVPEPEGDGSQGEAAGEAASAGIPSDNYLASQLHVICNDSDWPEDVSTYARNVEEDRERFPMYGAAGANITPCAFWPSEPVEEPVEITDSGPSNVLMLQNLRDNATPLSGARETRAALGDRARMVTADQGGHLAYLFLDNRCAHDLVTDFLVTGERPDEDVDCPAA